ncbi:hypothetical protein R0137_05285 [Congregibacter brevis]|uniref:Uncharacterized protein n=1 Tax=Congregibacter brevis TaxID=3081201 RepID=A0ABZ0IEK1_9GAMM|nr:hypothetical protein R0137_05285 [Congregibacter sp. IMCC45268]
MKRLNAVLALLRRLALLGIVVTAAVALAEPQQVDEKAIAAANEELAKAQEIYKAQLAPLEANLSNHQKAMVDAQQYKKDSDAALKAYEKTKKWYQKAFDDEKTELLKLQKKAADDRVSELSQKIKSTKQSIKTTEKARDSYVAFHEQKKLEADPAKVTAEAAKRAARISELNSQYYTRVAQKKAGERAFENKIATLEKLILESQLAGMSDVADAIKKDQQIIVDVKSQWEKGQDTAIETARKDLDAQYRANTEDSIGPTQWSGTVPADDPSFIDREAVTASALTASKVAGSALANTQQDMSVTAFVEDYGNTALIDPKTGNWDPVGVSQRYGAYAKGVGRATKDSVVDLGVMAVEVGETAVQATENAIGQSNLLGRDKIEKVYEFGNAVVDLSDADSAEAKAIRDKVGKTVVSGAEKGSRELEKTAAQGKKGVLKITEGVGYVAGTVVDPVFNAKGITGAKKAEAAADLKKLENAAEATRAERAANKVDDARQIDPLDRIDVDEMAARSDDTFGTSADEFASTMRDAGLEPQRTIELDGKSFHLSQPFESDGRTWVIALEETPDGKVIPRQFYLSGEHATWRAAPGFDGAAIIKGPRGPDGAFVNEGITDIDAYLQGPLDQLRSDFGVREIDAFDGKKLTTNALESPDAGAVPKALDTDVAKVTKPLPREANGKLPEGMRPDFDAGVVSVTRVNDHPLYGSFERVVVSSKDGSTNWIVNRTDSGDVWVGGMQDARSGITSLGTRNEGWDLEGLTAQPKTKSKDAKSYVDAEEWKNDVNRYMDWELNQRNLPLTPSKADPVRGPPAPPEGPPVVVRLNNGKPTVFEADGRQLELGEKLGEGSGAAVYAVKGRPDLVIKIGRPGANTRLDDFGSSVIREVDPLGTVIQVPTTHGRQAIETGLLPGVLDGEFLGGGIISIVDRAPTSFDKARKTGDSLAEMSAGKKRAYRNGMAALNAKGYVLLDNHPGNYSFKKKPGTEDEWILVIVDAETMTPMKSPEAAKDLQRALDDPSRYATSQGTPSADNWSQNDYGRSIHQEGLGDEFDGKVDWDRWTRETGSQYTSLGGKEAATHSSVVKFNPRNGIDNPDVAIPDDFVPDRVPRSARELAVAERDTQLDNFEAGLDKRRNRLEVDANPSDLPTKASIGQLTARGADKAIDQASASEESAPGTGLASDSDPQSDDESVSDAGNDEDPLILIGGGLSIVPTQSFAFGRTVWSDKDTWIEPQETVRISLGDDTEFELESAISLDGTNVHSQYALLGETVTESSLQVSAPPPPPPAPPASTPVDPPVEDTPLILIGPQNPVETSPVTEEPVVVEDQPPPPTPQPEEKKEIRIGRGSGGVLHKGDFSVSCYVYVISGDVADVSEATIAASGPGSPKSYDVPVSAGSEFRIEHEIYSYGSYQFEIQEVRDEQGEPMQIIGNPIGSYDVGAGERACW